MTTLQVLFDNSLFALFVVVGGGLLLGEISISGIKFGTSMVLLTALVAGHFGVELPPIIGSVGLVLFVYCVGIGAGGRFFRALAREGSALAKLSLGVTVLAAVLTVVVARGFGLPADLAAGIFAGALTSTPALAAADEAMRAGGLHSNLVIGYGIAYPFGIIGVVLFVQVLPRLMRWNLDEPRPAPGSAEGEIANVLVEVTNPALLGKPIAGSFILERHQCQVSRVLKENHLEPLSPDDVFAQSQRLLLVGERRELDDVVELIGRRAEGRYALNTDRERRRLLVTRRDFAGRTLGEIDPVGHYGVVVTRITRLGLTFVPRRDTVIENLDVLTTVGMESNLAAFSEAVGHRESHMDATDLLSLSVGIAAGVLLGMIPWALPGSKPITLGMAGGPLIAGLLLGHFGRVGAIVGHIPRPTRLLLQELGLVLFLADAGLKGGEHLVETVRSYGAIVFVMGMAVTLIPMLCVIPLGRKILRLSPLQTLGGICGGMTSTPALGALTSKTEAQTPIISYATAYPVALVIMTVLAKIVVSVLQ